MGCFDLTSNDSFKLIEAVAKGNIKFIEKLENELGKRNAFKDVKGELDKTDEGWKEVIKHYMENQGDLYKFISIQLSNVSSTFILSVQKICNIKYYTEDDANLKDFTFNVSKKRNLLKNFLKDKNIANADKIVDSLFYLKSNLKSFCDSIEESIKRFPELKKQLEKCVSNFIDETKKLFCKKSLSLMKDDNYSNEFKPLTIEIIKNLEVGQVRTHDIFSTREWAINILDCTSKGAISDNIDNYIKKHKFHKLRRNALEDFKNLVSDYKQKVKNIGV